MARIVSRFFVWVLLLAILLPAAAPAESPVACSHQWKLVKAVAPTCTKAGKNVYKCSLCGEKKTEKIPAPGHDWYICNIIRQPTCTEDGLKRCVCSRDHSHVLEEAIPAKGHKWSDWKIIRQPSWTRKGLKERSCGVCGDTERQTLAMLTADWVPAADPALADSLAALFAQAAMREDMQAVPVLYLASRVTDRTEHCFLARVVPAAPESSPYYAFVFLAESPSGEAALLDIVPLELGF